MRSERNIAPTAETRPRTAQWGRAVKCIRIARDRLHQNDIQAAVAHTNFALELHRSPAILRASVRVLYEAGEFRRAAQLAHELAQLGAPLTRSDEKLVRRVLDKQEVISWLTQPRGSMAFRPIGRRVINLLAYSLPYTSVGYATRSHSLARAIRAMGWDLLPFTRLGFPLDQIPELRGRELSTIDIVDGIAYHRLLYPGRRDMDVTTYLRIAIDVYRQLIDALRPAVVHGASNHITSLPALVAARTRGLPFIYEIRGFWEITRASSDPTFARTTTYRHIRSLETLVAQSADHVITLNEAMAADLVARGVPEKQISIAPNGVDPAMHFPHDKDYALAAELDMPADEPVIGYVGSFVDYEGLDDLVVAAQMLMQQGRKFRMLFVGDGPVLQPLREQIKSAGLLKRTAFAGRIDPSLVGKYYSLIDLCPFPRKPWQVCELVSPLKPLEAMSQAKAVLVSDVRALRELVIDGQTGLVFKSGSLESLSSSMNMLLDDLDLRQRISRSARKWVLENRTWRISADACVAAYETAIDRVATRLPA